MDQWLGTQNETVMAKMPEATIKDVQTETSQQKAKPKSKTFWSEFEKTNKKPVKIKIPAFKSYFQLIKEEREAEKKQDQREPIKIDWQKVKDERRNSRYNKKYNLQPDPSNV